MTIYVDTDDLCREALDLVEKILGIDLTLRGRHLLSNQLDIWISRLVAEIEEVFPDDDDDEDRAAPATACTALYTPRPAP